MRRRYKPVLGQTVQLVVMRQPSGYQRECVLPLPLPQSFRVPVLCNSAAAADWRGSSAPKPVMEMAFTCVEFYNHGHRTVQGVPVYESSQDVWTREA